MNHYTKYHDRIPDWDAFEKWLRQNGWSEDTSPSTENWPVPAWWHAGRMVTKREDYLVDDYKDHVYYEQKTKS